MFSSGVAISHAEVGAGGLGLPDTVSTVSEAAAAGGIDQDTIVRIIEDTEYLRYPDS